MEEDQLKLKKITIMGMHKVDKKTYEFNDGITYFVGENGAGKSTILEAVQLALLGYIPGYNKTNESIMKHACGPVMYVEAEFDNEVKITRTWSRSGSSVQAKTDVTGCTPDRLADMLSQVELPVFDFNEFKSMTANKLKEWFITFLPSSSEGLDIMKELNDALGARVIGSEELQNATEKWIKESGLEGLELVKALNAKFKEDQSYTKGQVEKLQGTIQSLVRYDEAVDLDEDEIKKELNELAGLKSMLLRYQTQINMRDVTQKQIDQLKSELPADIYENDPRVADTKEKIEQLSKKHEVLKADYDDLQSQIQKLTREKALLPRAGSTCPYTNTPCETAAKLAEESEAKAAELDKQIEFKKEELKDCDISVQSSIANQIMLLNADLGSIQSSYDRFIAMQLQLDNVEVIERPTEMTLGEIDNKYKDLEDALIQVAANKKYDELSETVTADKFKLENDLEVYKIWAKKTDANGLQTQLMDKPFENLASEMSAYLSQMFNKPITAKFNLVSKANSFSFGLERDNNYIEFDYLSSGERCLFTLALIMCILDKSNTEIRTILIDDILDHLDTSNASYLFDALKKVENIQFILAGVKECSDESICTPV